MPDSYITAKDYLSTAQQLSWFTLPQLQQLFHLNGRAYRLERLSKKLSDKGKLKAEQYGHLKAYIVPRLARKEGFNEPGHIYHGVATSQIIISFLQEGAEVASKKMWFGQGIYPDCTIQFQSGWLMPVEFATKEHSRMLGVYKSKVTRYISLLQEKWLILFVMDVPLNRLEYLVSQYTPHPSFYYITYEGFLQIPYGRHLDTPCYLNGATRKMEALR